MKKVTEFNMKKGYHAFIRSHNLVNRIYDMASYFGIFKGKENERNIKKFLYQRLEDITYVESLAKCFENKMRTKRCKQNIDLRYNLRDLIYDLDYLKQYLS